PTLLDPRWDPAVVVVHPHQRCGPGKPGSGHDPDSKCFRYGPRQLHGHGHHHGPRYQELTDSDYGETGGQAITYCATLAPAGGYLAARQAPGVTEETPLLFPHWSSTRHAVVCTSFLGRPDCLHPQAVCQVDFSGLCGSLGRLSLIAFEWLLFSSSRGPACDAFVFRC